MPFFFFFAPYPCANVKTISSTMMSNSENLPIYERILKKALEHLLCYFLKKR